MITFSILYNAPNTSVFTKECYVLKGDKLKFLFLICIMDNISIFRAGETASCTVVFILIYYFFMAGAIWFVMLAYAWHLTFKALGTPRDDLSNKTSYFHLASWSIPLVLTIVCLAVSEVRLSNSFSYTNMKKT